MSDEFVCPGCSRHFTKRQLRMTFVLKEMCPRCSAVIREGDGFHYENTEAIIAEDVAAIDAWLAAERQGLRLKYQQLRDREVQGEYHWRATGLPLAGCPGNGVIEVFYATKLRGVMAVRITCTDAEHLDDDVMRRLMTVYRDHGLQPHGSRHSSADLTGQHAETRWGGEQYLNTSTLEVVLLQPVLKRLIVSMRDALAMRNKRGTTSP